MKTIELTEMEAFELLVLLFDKQRHLDATLKSINRYEGGMIIPKEIPSWKNLDDELKRTHELIKKISGIFFKS